MRELTGFFILLLALGVAWFFAGGPSRSLSTSGPFLQPPTVGVPGTAYRVPSVQFVTPKGAGGTGTETGDGIVTTFTNYLGTYNEVSSPYSKYVTLERAQADATVAKNEYLTIRVSSSAPEPVTITGWRLESTATTLTATIPEASELPFLGSVTALSPVRLPAGASASVVTSRSPNGTSFRVNMCTGYFEQFQDFSPRLSLNCPQPTKEAEGALAPGDYGDACFNFVNALPRCTLYVNSIPPSVPIACQNFVHDRLTYNGCITSHKSDPKFYENKWYLYLNRDQELWRSRSERIRLLDEHGKVVAVVNY